MITTRTPLRVSFLGGGSDYPNWFHKHGGLVVGGAIDKFAYLTVRRLPPFHAYKHRLAYRLVETVNRLEEIQHAAIAAVIRDVLGDDPQGLEISHLADLPGGSGTGSSSSFVVGLLRALLALQGTYASPAQVAQRATRIEQEVLGENVGCQDQVFAAYGGLDIIKFRPGGAIDVFPLGLSREGLFVLEKHLILFFTGKSRVSSQVVATYAAKPDQFALMRLAEAGIEALQRGRYEHLGGLIDQSFRLKASLSPEVCPAEVSDLYATARVYGAFGGKLTGAGGGGCLLLVAPPEKQPGIIAALSEKGCVHIPFHFDFDGSSILFADFQEAA